MTLDQQRMEVRRVGVHGFSIVQVAIIVHDLDRTLRSYESLLGWGPWRMFDLGGMPQIDQRVRGKPQQFSVEAGLYRAGTVDFEIIKPSTPGSPQAEFAATGQGLHHIQVRGADEDRLRSQLDDSKIPILLSGKIKYAEDGEMEYRYYDKTDVLHAYVETTFGDRERFLKHVPKSTAEKAGPGVPPISSITHVGFVVQDLDRAVRSYERVFGWTPWEFADVRFEAATGVSAMKTATVAAGNIDIRLTEPLAAGHHRDFLMSKGPGLHDIGIAEAGRKQVRAALAQSGVKALGSDKTGTLFDTMDSLHLYVHA